MKTKTKRKTQQNQKDTPTQGGSTIPRNWHRCQLGSVKTKLVFLVFILQHNPCLLLYKWLGTAVFQQSTGAECAARGMQQCLQQAPGRRQCWHLCFPGDKSITEEHQKWWILCFKKGRFTAKATSPLTLLRSLEPAWEPGWEPPWELGWELGVLELEELPLLVLCSGLSMMGSVLLRSGLLQRHKENHQLRPQGLQGLPKLTDSFTVRRRLFCWGRQGWSLLLRSHWSCKPYWIPAELRGSAELGTQHLHGAGQQPWRKTARATLFSTFARFGKNEKILCSGLPFGLQPYNAGAIWINHQYSL